MKWGFFSTAHIISLLAAAAIITVLYFSLKRAPRKAQILVLGILSFSGIAAIIYNLVMWGSPLEYLPLHLCSVNALILPVAVFTRNKTLSNLLLLWSLGAVAALVVNTAQADFELMSSVFCFYYFPHMLEFGIPILLFGLGLVEKDPKCIGSTVLITVAVYTGVHLINLGLNAFCVANQICNAMGEVIRVNYMYSLIPENPIFARFHDLIPYTYWYMFLVFPIVAVYLAVVYTPQFLASHRKKQAQV